MAMEDQSGSNYLSLELEYILSEFYDWETLEYVEKVTGLRSWKVSHLKALKEALSNGLWCEARANILKLSLGDRAIALLYEQIAKEIVRDQGLTAAVVEYIQSNVTDLETITSLATTLLSDQEEPREKQRESCFFRIIHNSTYKTILQGLVNSALQFEDATLTGKFSKKRKASDVKSFVYSDLYLRVLHGSDVLDNLKKLELICSRVTIVNEFFSDIISKNLGVLLSQCMAVEPESTVNLLRQNPKFWESIDNCIAWNPLMPSEEIHIKPNFNFLEEYNSRRGSLPAVNSVLELGCIMQYILDPLAVSIPSDDFPNLKELYKPLSRFPLKPHVRITIGEQIWSLSSNKDGSKLAAGTSPFGNVYIYSFTNNSWSLQRTVGGNRAAEQVCFSASDDRLLVSRGGSVAALPRDDTTEQFSISSPATSDTYGSVCWHPKNKEYFFAARDSETCLKMLNFKKKSLVAQWNFPYFPLAISPSEDHIILLTGKIAGKNQHLLSINYETSEVSHLELPALQNDGMYTTLLCSTWDPRTILLLGSPNCIFLVDKYGQRRTRVFYGIKAKACLLRARFGGPMDKFIITSSEEVNPPRALVFNRFTGEVVSTLEGHRKLINDVEWLPSPSGRNTSIATASDDKTIVIYSE